ncbi:hypothetical protein [Nocardioides aquiterrae]|uniref:Gluconate 2-dehydrogenase subunit 3 family protein n=1 Tax=Nocardioides aquiterrae TaxID=203799 RepID=A0ABP4ETX1_9ACTN
MTAGFPHHSRPGYYPPALSEELSTYVATMAAALVPGGAGYPSGREAQVGRFVAERASGQDAEVLAAVAQRWPAGSDAEATASLVAMERDDPTAFAYLRELVYHGYYSSRRVLAAMIDRGYAYHGAPQPLGYPQSEELLVPSARRGSYTETTEVSRVDG